MAGPSDAQALILQVSADTSKALKQLDALNKKLSGTADAAASASKRASGTMERFFGKTDPGKAIDKIFDSTRFKLMDSGVARVGIFGSALESLGPAGLLAAAGVGAVIAAFAGAREAAKFADDINDTANNLHVTTDALQEYRYAIRAAGGEEKGADEALAAFSETLGKASVGLPKALRAFQELFGKSFTKDDVLRLGSTQEALDKVTKAMEGLSNEQKDALVAQFGLSGLKPLVEGGLDAMIRLREEAHKVGIVMDADLVKRGGDLNDQFETVSRVIDVQLKSALVDLGPVLVQLLGFMAELAKGAADIADAFRSIENKRTEHLKDLRAAFEKQTQGPLSLIYGDNARKKIAEIDVQLAKRPAASAPPPITPTHTLHDTSKARSASGPRDDTIQRTESVNAALDAAEKNVLQALLDLATSTTARASLQKQIAEREASIEQSRLSKQQADIKDDKGLSAPKKAELIAQLEIAKSKSAEAARLKQQAIDAQTADALAKEKLNLAQTGRDGDVALLQLQSDLTYSETLRGQIALRLVDIAYQKERAELEGVIAAQGVSDADKEIARIKLKQLDAQQPGKVDDTRRNGSEPARQANAIVGEVKKQGNLAEDTAAMYAEVDRLRQADLISEQEAAQAKLQIDAAYGQQRLANAQSFFGDLATLSTSSNKTLAAIGKAAAIAQATIDGILAVQKALASAPPPLNFVLAAAAGVAAAVNVAKIAGLAEGGPVTGPGGPRDDKILTRLSNGEFVVNALDAQRNIGLLHDINSGRAPRFANGGQVGRPSLPPLGALNTSRLPPRVSPAPQVIQPISFDLRGAVMTEDLLRQTQLIATREAARARAQAVRDVGEQRYREDLNS